MFKNWRNNYYFGKAGQGDLTPEDMPTNRRELFSVTLRTRLPELLRLNLLYALVWIPTLVVIWMNLASFVNILSRTDLGDGNTMEKLAAVQQAAEKGTEVAPTAEAKSMQQAVAEITSLVNTGLVLLIPCIAITGPFTAGVSYVCRNWARDEHAFVWSDFKDAVKDNWKQGLAVSCITGVVPAAVYIGFTTYQSMAQNNLLFVIPQGIVGIFGILWALSVTYMYPLMVSYELKFKDLMRNAFLLGVARLPMNVGIRLLHCVPVLLALGAAWLFPQFMNWAFMLIFLWYALIGLTLSRFVTASYTNAVFDRFINSRIKGAKVNQGLYREPEDEKDDSPTPEA